jgi:putative tryptophan/tyrosine transport system substrate-binding protein
MKHMRRREFIILLGSAGAAWPLAARAQQRSVPVIGYLSFTSPDERPTLLAAFLQGLEEANYVVGQNVAIEYRSARGHAERLPALVAELLKLPATVIAATGGEASARAAKSATSQIPIVFTAGSDPVNAGLVASLNRPGGNVTGASVAGSELDAKRLQLLHEFVPKAAIIGVLIDPNNSAIQPILADMDAAADVNGQRLVILNASTEAELKLVFASLQSQHIDALLVTTNPIYEGRRQQLVALAERYSVPVLYPWREYSVVGGLISFGASFTDTYRQVGSYVGQILKGAKPSDLPVVLPTKFELVINLRTAQALGLSVPTTLLVSADEVIE